MDACCIIKSVSHMCVACMSTHTYIHIYIYIYIYIYNVHVWTHAHTHMHCTIYDASFMWHCRIHVWCMLTIYGALHNTDDTCTHTHTHDASFTLKQCFAQAFSFCQPRSCHEVQCMCKASHWEFQSQG